MSDTPRTDAWKWGGFENPIDEISDLCKTIERELNAANARVKELEDWKAQAIAVERKWDPNKLALLLGGKLGASQRETIMREVPKLLDRVKELEAEGDEALMMLGVYKMKCEDLKAHVNRLEEAGNAMATIGEKIVHQGGEDMYWIRKLGDELTEWTEAKEVKL